MAFSLRSLQDTAQGVHDASKLDELFPRKSAPSEKTGVAGVWSAFGHTFVSCNGGRDLLALDSVPRSKFAAEGDGFLIRDHQSPILEILWDPLVPSKIYIVHQNSSTQCWEYRQADCRWMRRCVFQLSNAKGVEIVSIVFHSSIGQLFWCERRSSAASAHFCCCVCMRDVPHDWSDGMASRLGPVHAILHGCPAVSLFVLKKGICLAPILPEEKLTLLLFWTFVHRALKAYLWSYGVISDIQKTDFKGIISDLLCVWASNSEAHGMQHIISLTSHQTTGELVVLTSTSTISYFTVEDEIPVLTNLSTLSLNSPSISPEETISDIFCLGLYVGLIWNSGVVSLYEIRSGVQLGAIEGLKGQAVNAYCGYALIPWIGFWSPNGIWKLQSKPVVDVAGEMKKVSAKPLFPAPRQISFVQVAKKPQDGWNALTENSQCCGPEADCVPHGCTLVPGNVDQCLPDRPLDAKCSPTIANETQKDFSAPENDNPPQIPPLAAPCSAINFLTAWNLKHWAARLSLTFILSLKLLAENHMLDFEVPDELLSLLSSDCVQTPALVLALLWDHASLRNFLMELIENFVQQKDSHSADHEHQPLTQTALHGIMLPFFQELLELNQMYQSSIGRDFSECAFSKDVTYKSTRQAAVELLTSILSSPLNCKLLSKLETLTCQDPEAVLEGMAGFLAVEDTNEAVQAEEIEERWRQIFRLEWKNGRWRKSRVTLKQPHNALLSLLCHWSYFARPDWLPIVVAKGQAIVCPGEVEDTRPEEFITQSVLDCLPLLTSECPDKRALQTHNQLLWSTGQEMQALQVLLRHCKWQEALEFVSSCGEEASNLALLFTTLVKALLSNHAPRGLQSQALALQPSCFNAFELLAILKSSLPNCEEPFLRDSGGITLGDLGPFLRELLKPS